MPTVKELMTQGVEHIAGDATVQQAAERMAEKDIGFLAVANEQAAGGVITDRDIVVRCLAQHKNPEQTAIQQCMTTDIATITEDADLQDAGQLMEDKQIRRLLVRDADGNLSGVISLGDLATGCNDDHLRSEVLEKVSAECAPC